MQRFTVPTVGGGWTADEDDAATSRRVIRRCHSVERAAGDDDIFPVVRVFEIMARDNAQIEPRHRQARPHQDDAFGAVLAGQPQQREMSGMAGGDDQVGFGQAGAGLDRGSHTGEPPLFSGDGYSVHRAGHPPGNRIREAEGLVFVARLAIADQPNCERFRHRGDRMACGHRPLQRWVFPHKIVDVTSLAFHLPGHSRGRSGAGGGEKHRVWSTGPR